MQSPIARDLQALDDYTLDLRDSGVKDVAIALRSGSATARKAEAAGFKVMANRIPDGICPSCSTRVPGFWEPEACKLAVR